MKKGDLIFFHNKSIISRATALVETGKFGKVVPTHVAIVRYIRPEIILIEANLFKGVREVSIDAFEDCTAWYAVMKEPRDMNEGFKWLDSQLGKRYDKLQIVGIFFRAGFRLLGKRIYDKVRFVRNFLDSRQKLICSELVALFGEETGKSLWHHHTSQVTPFDLWRSPQITFYSSGDGNSYDNQ